MSTVLVEPEYHLELIDGREIQKRVPRNLHAFIQPFLIQWFGRELAAAAGSKHRVVSELNVLCREDRLVPDVTVVLRTAAYKRGDLADPAALAVEIMSPGQVLSDLMDRCERLLASGTSVCWLIWPERRKAWEYKIDSFREYSFMEASESLTVQIEDCSLSLPLTEMWAELD
ncbi:MAG: Uma2 family endonuclease [Acidobacteriota bacterium]|nr:Uma2 family endonuclease [Acidobacteriota bacterium]